MARKRRAPLRYYRLEDPLAAIDRLAPDDRPEVMDWGPDVGAEIIDDDYNRGLGPTSGDWSRN
jgi:antitoxin MazE